MVAGSPLTRSGPRAYLLDAAGTRLELAANRVYLLGRGKQCDLKVDDTECSRQHAKVVVGGDVRFVFLEDLGSKNGTLVNGIRATERIQLKNNDQIQIGRVHYRLEISDSDRDLPIDTKTTILKGR